MEYLYHILIIISIYSILALSLNLVVGYTGLPLFAHSAFYGVGAYTLALLAVQLNMSFWLAIILAALVTGCIAFLMSLLMSRFRDDLYFLVSAAINVVILHIFTNWQSLTRGPLGIPGIPRPDIFGISFSSNIMFLVLCLILLGLVYLGCRYITRSSFGRALLAIREDEGALRVFGYQTHRYKLLVCVISAMLAGIAGGLFASYITFIDPTSFTLIESTFIISIIILGGLASLRGSIAGAVALILLPEILRFVGFPTDVAAQMRQVVYGLLLVLFMMYRPSGLFGSYKL